MSGKSITIRDVAQRAGVAVSTASRALGGGSASLETKKRVLAAAKELNFYPNAAARRLTSGHSNVVALIVDEPTKLLFQDDFLVGILGQLSYSLSEVNLLPFLLLSSPDNEDAFSQLMTKSGADGVIVASMHEGRPMAEYLEKFGKPMVFIGRPPAPLKCPYVDVDNFDGGYLAARHLVERGCRNIAMIEGPKDMPTPRERSAGFMSGMHEMHMEPIVVCSGNYDMMSGQKCMEQILARHPKVDGVFAHSDKIAAGAIHSLHAYGRSIPQDVAIIGFDGLQIADLLTPQLTTLVQPLGDMADAATSMLQYRLQTGHWKVKSQRFPVQLAVRESA